jgi:transcriptional regulator with XRE-family HTH domain
VGHRASAELFTLIADELKRMVGDQSALNEIRDVLRLSETELGDLLKVRRQAVAQWRRRGIPSERAVEIDPKLASAHYNLSVTYLEMKPPRVELARRHYYAAIDLGTPPTPEIEAILKEAE